MTASRPSSAPIPPPPRRAVVNIRALFKLQDARRRWPFAFRAAVCSGMPVLIGWLAGDVAAGLLSSVGAFTALYGGDRPYMNRAVLLAVVAVGLAAAVTLGIEARSTPWQVVTVIAAIAAVAAFLCNALGVGPPGAYMFALACAAGTAIPVHHLNSLESGVLVLAGGAFAWAVHMLGIVIAPRRPERSAVAMAAEAVAQYIDAATTPQQDSARHAAALAMHHAWTTLVARQPAQPRPDGVLSRLRALNRELHLLFAQTVGAAAGGAPVAKSLAAEARAIARQAEYPLNGAERTEQSHVPLGHPGVLERLREALSPRSHPLLIAVRVAIATAIAGLIGAELGLERAYWTMASAVLMLHQGFDWGRTLQRGIERLVGTLVGLLLAGLVLVLHPEGLWLVATLMLLQFTIEMFIVRNYALAVVFITASALMIASGGQLVPDVAHLLWVRGEDTAIGCAVGLLVYLMTIPRVAGARIPPELGRTLDAVEAVVRHMPDGAVALPQALVARRDLQHRAIALLQAYDADVGASPKVRENAERMWPAVVATERLAYRVLSICWALETAGIDASRAMAQSLFGPEGAKPVREALASLAAAVRNGSAPVSDIEPPQFLHAELSALRKSLACTGA